MKLLLFLSDLFLNSSGGRATRLRGRTVRSLFVSDLFLNSSGGKATRLRGRAVRSLFVSDLFLSSSGGKATRLRGRAVRSLFVSSLAVILLLFSAQGVFAAELPSIFTMYPSYTHQGNSSWIIHDVKPGDTIKDYLTVENLSDVSGKFRVFFVEATETQGAFVASDENKSSDNIGNFVRPYEQFVELEPFQKRKIEFSYALPRDIEAAKYQGVFYVETVDENTASSGVSLKTRIGVRMYVDVEANAVASSATSFSFFATKNQILFFALSSILLIITLMWNLVSGNTKKLFR